MFARVALVLALGLCATAAQLRINAGGPYLPEIGWRKDTGLYRSANSLGFASKTPVITASSWAPVYQSHAYSFGGDLEYKIPVPAGTYSVFLLFAETWSGAVEGTRQFSLTVNGVQKVAALDVFAAGGGAFKPVYITVSGVDASGGFVTVTLGRIAGKNNPMISGIVIEGTDPAAKVGNEGVVLTPAVTPSVSASASAPVLVSPSPEVVDITVSPSPSVSAAIAGPACVKASEPYAFKMNVAGPKVVDFVKEDTALIVGPVGFVATSKLPVTVAAGSGTGALYLTERYTTAAALTYKIPTPAGTYTVKTHHAESYFAANGKRVFDILINGAVVRANLDVHAAAPGKDVALVLEFPDIPSVGGFITISFTKKIENPLVNAIEILRADVPCPTVTPSVSASVAPVIKACVNGRSPGEFSLNVAGPALADSGFGADNVKYIVGNPGLVATTSSVVTVAAGSNTAAVYNTERYTFTNALTYKIPVPAGTYTVQTLHAETFFAANGKRVFNIVINGAVVKANLDVRAAANGRNVALVQSFDKIASVNGFITISFTKGIENPMVNGIKIIGVGAETIATGSGCSVDGPSVTPSVSASAGASLAPSSSVTPSASPSVPAVVAPSCVTGRGTDSFSMNIAGPAYENIGYGAENTAYISGAPGLVFTSSLPVQVAAGSLTAPLYFTERYTQGASLTYKIPVPAGKYTVETHHAESYYTLAGARVFNVVINDAIVKANLDVFVAAGGKDIANVQSFPNIDSVGGYITISFTKGGAENPLVNAIKITGVGADTIAIGGGCAVTTPSASASAASAVPSSSAAASASASVSAAPTLGVTPSPSPSTDPNACDVAQAVTGRAAGSFSMNVAGPAIGSFGGDNVNYIVGDKGKKSTSNVGVLLDGKVSPVFFTERFTFAQSLTYKIPVPAGSYSVTTYHAESFFNAAGSRVFNIVINGNAVATALDVFASKGKDVALVQTFPNIASVGGYITIEFTKSVENPFVNGIKITGPGADTIAIAGREDGSCKAPF